MTLAAWSGFFLAALAIALSPGPGAALIVGAGINCGYRGALPAIAGLQVALLVHLAAVALGLGALLATSGSAFAALRLAGACYLVWLGVEKWRQPSLAAPGPAPAGSGRMLFRQGLLVNLANPKAIVFMAALVPQFIDTGSPRGPQFALIATTLCLVDVAVMSGYALAGARIGPWLNSPRAVRAQNRIFGILFIAAGLVLAFAQREA